MINPKDIMGVAEFDEQEMGGLPDPTLTMLRQMASQIAKCRTTITSKFALLRELEVDLQTTLNFNEIQVKFLIDNFSSFMQSVVVNERGRVVPLQIPISNSQNCVGCGEEAIYFTRLGIGYCRDHQDIGKTIDAQDSKAEYALGFKPIIPKAPAKSKRLVNKKPRKH